MAFLVRWLHVTSASFLLGGALFLFLALYLARRRGADLRPLRDFMHAYEWASWLAVGLIVMTGVGNLGYFGEALPAPESEWGRELLLKLGLVAVFLAFSAVRTLSLVLAEGKSPPALGSLEGLYGATALLVAGILGVALALAHF